jgi:predicted transglutaminase-like cysteine proteinase
MLRLVAALATVLSLCALPAATRAETPFDETQSGAEFSQFPAWKQVLADMASAKAPVRGVIPASLDGDQPQAACADERRCAPQEWTDFLDTLGGKSRHEQIEAVNRWVNQKPYVEDMANWGVADYWETPGEFLAHGGDCEDFAITKYFSLVRLGVPAEDLRLTIVRDSDLGAYHAVLEVRDQDQAWLMDNQLADVVPVSAMPRYQTIYALNAQGWWMDLPPRIDLGSIVIVAAAGPRH